MLIFMFFSSFFVLFRFPLARNAHFRDKGTTFFAYTQAHDSFFYKKSGKVSYYGFLFHLQKNDFLYLLFLHERSLQALRDIDHIVAHMFELVDNIDVINARLVVLVVVLQRFDLCLAQFVA